MPTCTKSDEPIQITEDLAFQVRMNRFQRIGRWLFFVLIVCALAGLSGGGILSHKVARDADGRLSLQFERFARMTAHQSIELEVCSDQPQASFELSVDPGFVTGVQIDSIVPQPHQQSSSPDGVRMNIPVNPPSQCAPVFIRYRAFTAGWLRGRLTVAQSSVSFEQFVYP